MSPGVQSAILGMTSASSRLCRARAFVSLDKCRKRRDLQALQSPAIWKEGSKPALPLPDKPSIAVLPFQNISGDPEQEYFADGIVEEIITALTRFKTLFVIARNSSFKYRGRAVDVKQVGRELGVRYVLEAASASQRTGCASTGQLVDTTIGTHIWADRFDGALEDIFDLQDQLSAMIVGAISPKLEQAEIERARRKPTESLHAYDYTCVEWRAFIAGAGKLLPKPWSCSKGNPT